MCTHRNVVLCEKLDHFDLASRAFELDHHRAAFLHQAYGIVECLFRHRVTHEWHIRH